MPMFCPINRGRIKECSEAGRALHSYISLLSSADKVEWSKLFCAIIEKESVDECDKKTLFNAVLQADIESLDVSRADALLVKSREAFFLLIEKLIDAKRVVLPTKMLNLARRESVFSNKYFWLRKRLRTAIRCMYTMHVRMHVDKTH